MMDYDKTPSMDNDSNMGTDEDDSVRLKSRPSVDDDRDCENEDSNETNPRNIWRKRRKLSPTMQTEPSNIEPNDLSQPIHEIKQEFIRSNSIESESYPSPKPVHKRPYDHQVPSFVPTTYHDDTNISNRFFKKQNSCVFFLTLPYFLFLSVSSYRHLPPKKQSSLAKRNHLDGPIYRTHSSSTSDLSSYDPHQRCKT
jgi:hypothetical protein